MAKQDEASALIVLMNEARSERARSNAGAARTMRALNTLNINPAAQIRVLQYLEYLRYDTGYGGDLFPALRPLAAVIASFNPEGRR